MFLDSEREVRGMREEKRCRRGFGDSKRQMKSEKNIIKEYRMEREMRQRVGTPRTFATTKFHSL